MNIIWLYAAAFFLQPAVMNAAAYEGMGPDLLLCLTVLLIAAEKEPGPVTVISTAAALLQDLCCSMYAGPGGLAILAAALCALFAFRLCAWERPGALLMLVMLETMIYHMVLWAAGWVMGAAWTFLYMLRRLPVWIIYNSAACAVVYAVLMKKRKETYRQ